MAHVKVHGVWPNDDQLKAFEGEGRGAAPALALVTTSPGYQEIGATLVDAHRIVLGGNWYALADQLVTGPINADSTHNLAEWSAVDWDRLDAGSRVQCLRAKTMLVSGGD